MKTVQPYNIEYIHIQKITTNFDLHSKTCQIFQILFHFFDTGYF